MLIVAANSVEGGYRLNGYKRQSAKQQYQIPSSASKQAHTDKGLGFVIETRSLGLSVTHEKIVRNGLIHYQEVSIPSSLAF
jgi:hypothetical protein